MTEQESAVVIALFIVAAMGILLVAGHIHGWGKGFAAGWNACRWIGKTTPPDPLKVIECKPLGGHLYELTTESKQYGRVTQNVYLWPKEFFPAPGGPT